MKHEIVVLGVLVVALALFAVPSVLAGPPANAVYISPEDSSGLYCENNTLLEVRINTSLVTMGADMDIYFDPSCVNITAVNWTDSAWPGTPAMPPTWTHRGDHIHMISSNFFGAPAGDNLYAQLTLHCVNEGECKSYLGFSKVVISDVMGEGVDSVLHNGTFACEKPWVPPEGKYLHLLTPLVNITPPPSTPEGTEWHELYPVYCNNYTLTSWHDNNDGVLSPSDYIDMTDEAGVVSWYHVDVVTVTILVQETQELEKEMYLDFKGGYEAIEEAIKRPVCTGWHEIWPEFCNEYHLSSWKDENGDGILSPGDQIDMTDEEGTVTWYHVEEVTIDIVVTPVCLGNCYSGLDCEDLEKKNVPCWECLDSVSKNRSWSPTTDCDKDPWVCPMGICYNSTVGCPECADGSDNDTDGLIDCDDPECACCCDSTEDDDNPLDCVPELPTVALTGIGILSLVLWVRSRRGQKRE